METVKRKIKLTNKKERAILSDTLPYETPPTFSNEVLYQTLLKLNIEIIGSKVSWNYIDRQHDLIISVIFNFNYSEVENLDISDSRTKTMNDVKSFSSIPFDYKIKKGSDSFRNLSLIHPKNQVTYCSFYEKYKNLIIYLCNIDSFSIRKPKKVASSVVFKESISCTINSMVSIIETGEYTENFKSYFVYKDFSNIHKFFESDIYHQCEKNYNNMAKIDISHCFNSIYTHSIAWAIFGKIATKNVLSGFISGSLNNSFADDFDKLIQDSNYKETNGIPVGSEVSRIFAEIILQRIDNNVISALTEKNIIHKHDYTIFRYVDDYFIFYNNESTYKVIVDAIQYELHEYKLSLNKSKEIIYNKPIITEITIAKKQITSLFEDKLKYITEIAEDEKLIGRIKINSRSLIIDFKSILKNSGVDYENIMNYSLAIIERKLKVIIETHNKISNQHENKNSLSEAFSSIIQFTFFIYSVSPKVNSTIKLCRILNLIIQFTKSKNISIDEMHILHREIYENIVFILEKNKANSYNQVETLYLLISLSELGKYYRISEGLVQQIFGISTNGCDAEFRYNLNYFSLTVLLFYIKNIKRYDDTRNIIEDYIKNKLHSSEVIVSQSSELLLLAFDTISCPYVSDSVKTSALQSLGITDLLLQDDFKRFTMHWFTKWDGFDLGHELDRKRSLEVY
ncbi:antiviral reverse transcriptase Drt3b [Aliivibrio fischeri]|uniref:antiviral reverse transcriptase Drt3b n=1 Tax=Aliivibrio fischeri TaxID=668 RepID=UPI0012D86767|nr:antiviral reverse transcriptase Drt3b [Aliivibrio fischeri]MUJ19779.1 ABC transporter ATP-binding protein [Aliivibrio fischeri]